MSRATSPLAVVSRLAALVGKERRLLARDRAGLAIVFFMPMALVLIVTVIQDATFRSVNETRVPILLADFDGEAVGRALRGELARTGFFELHDAGADLPAGEMAARDAVAAGRYLLAVVVPKGTTLRLRERAAARHAALLGLAAPPGGEGASRRPSGSTSTPRPNSPSRPRSPTPFGRSGYGVAVGAAAETEEQASSFGALSVIILAALGGVFVPVFVMPPFMRRVSVLSPLNWGMEGFSGVFLRGADLVQILPQALRLLLFGAVFSAAALAVRRLRDAR